MYILWKALIKTNSVLIGVKLNLILQRSYPRCAASLQYALLNKTRKTLSLLVSVNLISCK